jgi:hypothetical protein
VPTLRAVKLRRKGIGIELSPSYFTDAGFYCEAAERQMATPTPFDLLGVTEAEPVEVAPQGRSIRHGKCYHFSGLSANMFDER